MIYGQLPALEDKLQGKDRVEEIMEIVDIHYAEIESGVRDRTNEINYKHWARWGLYMSSRTDAAGRIVNVDRYVKKAHESYASTQRISYGNWVPRGPSAISGTNGSAVGIGRVDRIAFHPTDVNILYIGTTAGGLFKSTNGGSSWTALTDNIPSTAISGIVVSHANPNTIYILTGDGDTSGGGFIVSAGYWRSSAGVFVSYDAGTNWYPTAPLPIVGTYAGYQLIQDPNDANILLAATDEGVYRTTNGGGSWELVLAGRTYEIKFKPGSSTYVYATQSGEFHRSTNGGVDWNEITDFDFALPNGRVAMAVTNALTNRVYLLSGWATGGTFGGAYISYDSGSSFTRQSNTPNIVESACDGTGGNNQSSYDLAIGVSHALTSRVVAAGVTTWRSSNTGVSWVNASAGRCDDDSESTGFVHADVHDIEYNPLNGNVYVCTDGGLIRSANHGLDWVNLSDGIAASQIYHMAGSLTDIDNMIIGLQDNGCKRRNANTSTWDQVLSADGFDCIYNDGSSTDGYLSWNSSVNRFWNNGANRAGITPPGSSGFFPRVASAINDGTLVLAGYSDIYKSEDSGNSWTNEGAAGNWDIERCPSNENRFYAAGGSSAFATTGVMYFSSDMGDSWSVISTNPGYPAANIRLTDIDVRPNNSGNVWITFGGFSDGNKVFYSLNSGGSWTNMSGSLPNVPVNAIQVDANNNAYIGTDLGVFYRGAGMSDWVPFWHRLPIIPVTDLELYEADGIIRAATFGRGVWESEVYSSCSFSLGISGNLSGNRYYEASSSILSSNNIFGGSNTRVIFKAGDYITLTTGFQVAAHNKFRAYLAPCGVADLE
jgi:hypothetical protein